MSWERNKFIVFVLLRSIVFKIDHIIENKAAQNFDFSLLILIKFLAFRRILQML